MTDLLYSETEDALRDSVRSLLATNCPSSRIAVMYDGENSLAGDLWQTVNAAMDLGSLSIPESLGGAGASPREVAVVVEELGRAVAPIPFLTSAVIATEVLAACAADDLLGSLTDGSQIAVLAAPWTSIGVSIAGLPVVDSRTFVSGRVLAVADAQLATMLLVPATRDGVLTIQAIDVNASGVTVTPRSCLDMSRVLCDIDLSDAPATEVAEGEAATRAIQAGLDHGAAMLASEQVGIAQWCLDETVAYVKQRHQFGRSIGSFQAIKHRLARLFISVESARAAARNAACLVPQGDDEACSAIALAQSYCSDVAVLAAEECVQLHGGIGMTWEHPAHLYLKRAKADQIALGSPAQHRAVLARMRGL